MKTKKVKKKTSHTSLLEGWNAKALQQYIPTHRPSNRLTHPCMVTKNWGLLESRQTYLQFLMLQDFLARFVLEIGASLWNTEKRTSILTNGQRNLFIEMEGHISFEITYWKLMQYCKLYRRITKVLIHVFYLKLRKITQIAKISFAYLCKCTM